jgi:hypothetical protein
MMTRIGAYDPTMKSKNIPLACLQSDPVFPDSG